MDTQTIDFVSGAGIEYGVQDCPSGISVDEWMNRLGKKLIEHYDDDFRRRLNKARAERNLLPL